MYPPQLLLDNRRAFTSDFINLQTNINQHAPVDRPRGKIDRSQIIKYKRTCKDPISQPFGDRRVQQTYSKREMIPKKMEHWDQFIQYGVIIYQKQSLSASRTRKEAIEISSSGAWDQIAVLVRELAKCRGAVKQLS